MLFEQHEDFRPVMWLRGHPFYATHCLVLAYVITMVVAAVIGPLRTEALSMMFEFDSRLVHHWQVWRILTYGLVNPPTVGFVIDMVMFIWFGREVERFFGRRKFLRFYAVVYLITPLLFTLGGFFRPLTLVGETGGLAFFIAFATVYPGALLIFAIPAMWWAIGAVGVGSLIHLFSRDFIKLSALLITVGFAFAFVRYQQGRLWLPNLRLRFNFAIGRRRPKLRVMPDPDRDEEPEENDPATAEVDALLDKIAKHGIGSLSSSERARLEKAREDLMKRESPRR
jgi:membrane associated rhomboid family serine protease